jgi:hypothetical protein
MAALDAVCKVLQGSCTALQCILPLELDINGKSHMRMAVLMGSLCNEQAQKVAALTVKLLDRLSSSDNAFDAAFLANHASAAAAFDCVVRVTLPAAANAALTTADAPAWRYLSMLLGALTATVCGVGACCYQHVCAGFILASSQHSLP